MQLTLAAWVLLFIKYLLTFQAIQLVRFKLIWGTLCYGDEVQHYARDGVDEKERVHQQREQLQ
jgi:hypothetical protein